MGTNSSLSVILNEVKNLSRSSRSKKAAVIRWVTAPQSSLPGTPAVQGVMLAANENVQWSWTHTANGSYVNGYTNVRRLAPRAVILSAAKNLSRSKMGSAKAGRIGSGWYKLRKRRSFC